MPISKKPRRVTVRVQMGKPFDVECEVTKEKGRLVVEIKSLKFVALTFITSTLAYGLYHYAIKWALNLFE